VPDVVRDNINSDVNIPSIDGLVESVDDKLNTAKAYSKAKKILNQTLDLVDQRLIEVDNPLQLTQIAERMGKLINGFDENKKDKGTPPSIIIYKPEINNESHYGDVIHALE
jgi:hypothetical protein